MGIASKISNQNPLSEFVLVKPAKNMLACGMRFVLPYLALFMLLLLGGVGGGIAHAASDDWQVWKVDNVEYVEMEDVCRFYKYLPKKGKEGYQSFGSENYTLSIKAGKQDLYVNSFRYILSYPIREHNGKLLISAVDMKKLVDPVLRPVHNKQGGAITTIVIDAGHGGHDAGAVSPWAKEKDCNLAVARKLRARLQKAGLKVVMTRDSDVFLTLGQRVAIANKTPNCLFISIHHNSGRRAAKGIETFTLAPHGTTSPFAKTRRREALAGNNQDSANIALATAVHSRAIRATKAVDRGIQRARFSVLCTITRPAILFEGGFVSNKEEGRQIATSAYQDKLADSICQGILSYIATVQSKPLKQRNYRTGGGSIHGSGNRYHGSTRLK